MPIAPLRPRRNGKGPDIPVHTVGNALVLHGRESISQQAQSIALRVAKDPDHDVVILDMPERPSINTWEAVASALPRRRRSGIRLVVCGDSPEPASLIGQWLAERLGRPVVAPHGRLTRSAAGALFVHSGPGTGWIRFRPGKEPAWEGKRYPRPVWDHIAADDTPTSSVAVAEPMPGGVWIHDTSEEPVIEPHRKWLSEMVPCHPDILLVLLGCPGTRALPVDDIYRFWRKLDAETRSRVRFVGYGPVDLPGRDPLGQALADALSTPVVCYAGVPIGAPDRPQMFTVDESGSLCWQAFAEELSYTPRETPTAPPVTPRLLSHRAPMDLGEQIEPGVYQYAEDAVVEVLQSGLWVRPAEVPREADRIRAALADAERHTLVFDDANEHRAVRMRSVAEDVAGQLDPPTRARTELIPGSVVAESTARGRSSAGGSLRSTTPAPATTPVAPIAPPPAVAGSVGASGGVGWQEPAAAPRPAAEPVTESRPVAPAIVDAPLASEPVQLVPERGLVPPQAPMALNLPAVTPPVEPGLLPPDRPVPDALVPSGTWPPTLGAGPAMPPPAPVAPPADPSVSLEAPPSAPPATPPAAHTPPVQQPGRRPVASAAPRRPARPAPARGRLQPAPDRAASALISGRGLTEERAWLRRSLSREFDAMATVVSRVLSEHPGLQGGSGVTANDVMTDSVAVRLYLSPEGTAIDAGLRAAKRGPHVPFARCAVSGLSRLPSHRGATTYATTLTEAEWQILGGRSMLTEWGFLNALSAPSGDLAGDTDVLIWSMSARRTKLLEPDGDEHAENRVLFLPGTSFKVLDLVQPAADRRGQVLLREVAANEIEPDGRVQDNRASFDDLATTSLRRCLERWADAEPPSAVGTAARRRFGTVPGLAQA